MNDDADLWIHGYLDGTLTDAQFAALSEWLRSDPANSRHFAHVALLHNRLADLHRDPTALPPPDVHASERTFPRRSRWWTITAAVAVACAAMLGAFALFNHTPGTVSAATLELSRVIAAQVRSPWRSYRIIVENERPIAAREDKKRAADGRPPKPSLSNARLHVGPEGRFVLAGDGPSGRWIAGSDGHQSWSVRGSGDVLVSDDPLHFRRDVPGHEHAMPLNELEAMLNRLRESYDVVVSSDDSSRRLLIATKRRGQRGPRQVEVSYDAASDELFTLRFVDMPHGTSRLTLRLEPLPSESAAREEAFFESSAHRGRR